MFTSTILVASIVTAASFSMISMSLMQSARAETFPGINGKIAFTSYRDGNQELYVMNADGTGQTNLSNNVDDSLPNWSPDGSKIAFFSLRDGNGEVYVMNANGKDQTNLSDNATIDFQPD